MPFYLVAPSDSQGCTKERLRSAARECVNPERYWLTSELSVRPCMMVLSFQHRHPPDRLFNEEQEHVSETHIVDGMSSAPHCRKRMSRSRQEEVVNMRDALNSPCAHRSCVMCMWGMACLVVRRQIHRLNSLKHFEVFCVRCLCETLTTRLIANRRLLPLR